MNAGPATGWRAWGQLISGWVAVMAVMALLAGCTTPPFQPHLGVHTQAFAQPERSPLTAWLLPPGLGPQHTALRLLDSGHEAFAARAALAEGAAHTLDLQYHIVEHDDTAGLLLQRLLRAADRGVRVRLLVDDLGVGHSEAVLAALAQHPNLSVRLFNPFHWRGAVSRAMEWLGSDKRLNQRMHNKLWIADNAAAVIGGRNLGDAYFDASPTAAFSDLDLLVAGAAVREASASFDLYWNSDWAVPVDEVVTPPSDAARVRQALDQRADAFRQGDYVRTLRASEFAAQLRQATVPMLTVPAQVLADRPASTDPTAVSTGKTGAIFPVLRQAVLSARREVMLVSPYFVPGEGSIEALCALVARGVAVRVLTNSLASTDVPAVHAGYARYRQGLLACGVQLFELRPANGSQRQRLSSGSSLHAKAVVIDRHWVLMGSMNLDARSRRLNTEVALQVDSTALGAQLGALFDASTTLDQVWQPALAVPGDARSAPQWRGLDDGRPVTLLAEPQASAWRQAAAALLGWLIDEELL